MLKKIYKELVAIRKELQSIRRAMECIKERKIVSIRICFRSDGEKDFTPIDLGKNKEINYHASSKEVSDALRKYHQYQSGRI